MRLINRALKFAIVVPYVFAFLCVPAHALDVSVGGDYRSTVSSNNVGGGFDYLPDGDVLALSSDFATGPALYLLDANGDGAPKGGRKVLEQFDPTTFPAFVQVAPNGSFALVGVSAANISTVYRVNLRTEQVIPYFAQTGSAFDLVFADNGQAYLSSNVGIFDPAVPNEIYHVTLGDHPTLTAVAEFFDTPSGPVEINAAGDLYYIKGTFIFPSPPGTSRLFRFDAAAVAAARANGTKLRESDASASVALDGGYDLVVHSTGGSGALFISTISNEILRLPESTLIPEVFLTVTDTPGSTAGLTALSLLEPTGVFDASAPNHSELGVAVATNFFSDNSFLQIRPNTFGPRRFAAGLFPANGSGTVRGRSLRLQLERFLEQGVSYEVELRRGGRSARVVKSRSSRISVAKLPKGTWRVRYRAARKTDGRKVRTQWSVPLIFEIG